MNSSVMKWLVGQGSPALLTAEELKNLTQTCAQQDIKQCLGHGCVFLREYYPLKTWWTEIQSLQDYPASEWCQEWCKMWPTGSAHIPKQTTTSSVKRGGGGIMSWTWRTATGTGTLIFIDDLTAEGSSTLSSDVYRLQNLYIKLYASGFIMWKIAGKRAK